MQKKNAVAIILVSAFLIMAAAVSVSSPVWAAENETAPIEPTLGFQPISEIFSKVGYALPIAIIVGLFTCMLGYLRKTPPEQFKLVNFIYTMLLSLIIGIATLYGGWTYIMVQEWLGNGALTLYIYWLAKIIAIKLGWKETQQATGPPSSTITS